METSCIRFQRVSAEGFTATQMEEVEHAVFAGNHLGTRYGDGALGT